MQGEFAGGKPRGMGEHEAEGTFIILLVAHPCMCSPQERESAASMLASLTLIHSSRLSLNVFSLQHVKSAAKGTDWYRNSGVIGKQEDQGEWRWWDIYSSFNYKYTI